MCYYATTDYLCGDWKWGNMMLRCPRQHRIGETCGAKLVHHESVTKSSTICKICEEISTKERRLSKTQDNINRWSREPDKFSASLEKARREANELQDKVRDLHLRRPSIATNIHSAAAAKSSASSRSSSSMSASGTTLPPVAALTGSVAPRYEYTSSSGIGRAQDTGNYMVPRNGVVPSAATAANGISFNHNSSISPYKNAPVGHVLNRNTAGISGVSANMALDRQGGAYTVSYARR